MDTEYRLRTSKKAKAGAIAAVIGAIASMVTSGCVVQTDNTCRSGTCNDSYVPRSSIPPEGSPIPQFTSQVQVASIETDATMTSTPGQGVGLMIEYRGGGTWQLTTTCDTAIHHTPCQFEVFMQTPENVMISNLETIGFEHKQTSQGSDQVDLRSDGLAFSAVTEGDTDGIRFHVPNGEPVRFWVWVDGVPDSRFVYWVQDGVVRYGAPTNPMDLLPTVP